MSIAVYLKNNLKSVPPGLGSFINKIPYSLRPGIASVYKKRKKEIEWINGVSVAQKKEFVFLRMFKITCFAYDNIKFYKEYYDSKNFNPHNLTSFDDLTKIPIINKSILNSYSIEDRSFPKKGRYVVNTGGTSGTPFGFYIEPSSMGHEWAHMHHIWEKLNYSPQDLKLVFAGRSDVKNGVEYDVVRNHFALDIYAGYDNIAPKLIQLASKHTIKYLHGYPSSIYDFACYCKDSNPTLLKALKKNLVGAFLGSEYPHAHYRKLIEDVFEIKTISWYGHTERAILAFENEKHFEYVPFHTYGFSEAIQNDSGSFDLICTSYYNEASPLIRYNTEDSVENPIYKENLLHSFEILKGRNGEFVIDNTGKKINLTALIFGRHHVLFNHSKFIQVRQVEMGKIEILYGSDIPENQASSLFDSNNLNFDIKFVKIDEPIRTISGKIGLLIK
jgi:phenylacetate-CoA ligase